MSGAYYNDVDEYVCQWVRNLIKAGLIADGEVDCRSIESVRGSDLAGFTQVHMFCGIAIWSYALWLAGWPDGRPVWTGSCPCQPFSAAGRSGGFGDERHLWPHWSRLIGECRPDVIFGEQVASSDGLAWLDFICADLEAASYAVGALDTCAAGFGAPHIRQRLYFVADSQSSDRRLSIQQRRSRQTNIEPERGGETGELADAESQHDRSGQSRARWRAESANRIATSDMGDAERAGLQEQRRDAGVPRRQVEPPEGQGAERTSAPTCENQGAAWVSDERTRVQPGQLRERFPTNGFWSDAEWLPCIDGKTRPTKPGIFPLAHGAAARVGRLRAYGNCIVAPQAAEFIKTYMIRELQPAAPPAGEEKP